MKFLLALASLPLLATTTVRVVGISHTNAVFEIKTDQVGACTFKASLVSDFSGAYAPLNDVNTALFAGSDSCARSGGDLTSATRHVFVLGNTTGTSEQASDGRWYSRTLEVERTHYYQVTVGADTVAGSFTTGTIPAGASWRAPQSRAPSVPLSRTAYLVDPETGLRLIPASLPTDVYTQATVAVSAPAATTGWTNPGALTADDTTAAVFSGAGQNLLWVPVDIAWRAGFSSPRNYDSSFTYSPQALVSLTIDLNAWGAAAGTADRSIDICISQNGSACIPGTSFKTSILNQCTSSCETGNRPTIGDTVGQRGYWITDPFVIPDSYRYTWRDTTVNTSGTTVTRTDGHVFDVSWQAGTRIVIAGTTYLIQQVNHSDELILQSSAGTQTGVAAESRPFGLLVRKSTTTTDSISIQWLRANAWTGKAPDWPAGAFEHNLRSCSALQGSKYYCAWGGYLYAVDATTLTATPAGPAVLPFRASPGWNTTSCGNVIWHATEPAFYCTTFVDGTIGQNVIVKATLTGTITADRIVSSSTALVECGSAPCWTFTRETATTLESQMNSFKSGCLVPNSVPDNIVPGWILHSTAADRILVVHREGQDHFSCLGVWSTTTKTFVAALRFGKDGPSAWGVNHSQAIAGPSGRYVYLSLNPATLGSLAAGTGGSYGTGPYYSLLTANTGTSTATCPSRPVNSPIPAGLWPSGSKCLTISVDGWPGDPSRHSNAAEPSDGGVNLPAGRSTHYYQGPAKPGDIICMVQSPSGSTCPDAASGLDTNEWMRVLTADSATSWVVQRGWSTATNDTNSGSIKSYTTGATLLMMPHACRNYWAKCSQGDAIWDTTGDPQGTTLSPISTNLTSGHNGFSDTLIGWGVASCPVLDFNPAQISCYAFQRSSDLPSAFAASPQTVTLAGMFAGKSGVGFPNDSDTHVAVYTTTNGEQDALDGRQFNRINSANTAIQVSGDLYKFAAGTVAITGFGSRSRPKYFDDIAFNGRSFLTDISPGPITASGSDLGKYCYVITAGDCFAGSVAGEVYVNSKSARRTCQFPGVAIAGTNFTDLCVGDAGLHLSMITQTKIPPSGVTDLSSDYSRNLTSLLMPPAMQDVFLAGTRLVTSADIMVARAISVNEGAGMVFLSRIPSWPKSSDRGSYFQQVSVNLGPGSNAEIEFGYTPTFRCMNRPQACFTIASPSDTNPYRFASETQSLTTCTSGCTINIPARRGRVLYYRIRRGAVVGPTVVTVN